jgi:hypothetical protein
MFLEKAIMHMEYMKIGTDIMEFLVKLMEIKTLSATSTGDFVDFAKVKDNNPKILTINALLSIVYGMLEDTSEKRSAVLDDFAPRVLASLIQAKPSILFRYGCADYEIL